jgi:hypothetical protein
MRVLYIFITGYERSNNDKRNIVFFGADAELKRMSNKMRDHDQCSRTTWAVKHFSYEIDQSETKNGWVVVSRKFTLPLPKFWLTIISQKHSVCLQKA